MFGMGTGVTLSTKSPENLFEISKLRSQISKRMVSGLGPLDFDLRPGLINRGKMPKTKDPRPKTKNRIVTVLGKFAQARICCLSKFYGQAKGLISSGQLSTLLHLHIQPINLVVYEESHWQN